MSKGLRLTEKWMQRGLWLVAFVFAGFLIGLGDKVVANLRFVEAAPTVAQFIDPVQGPRARQAAELAKQHLATAEQRKTQARHDHAKASENTALEEAKFNDWLKTRQATANRGQDAELLARTRTLDNVRADERAALGAVEAQEQALLDAGLARDKAAAEWERLEKPALVAVDQARTRHELRVFLFRLALTLPLLLVAGWLFAKKRQSQYWPFVWGFIYFALFAFFVELVPYLPSYGGYVRHIVGIVLTVVIGRYAIISLQKYLARQKEVEALPDVQRRETLRYDTAIARLGKSVCAGCERPVNLADPAIDFCPHCGIGLFDRCGKCNTRKGAFLRYCFSCGTPGKAALTD